MTRFDQWFSTIFLGAVPPLALSLACSLFLPFVFPLSGVVSLILGFALGIALDCLWLRHSIVMAYVCRPFMLVIAALFYAAWLLYVLRGCPVANMVIGPAMAWIIGRRRRLNDQTREQLRASLRQITPWLLSLFAVACVIGILSSRPDTAFVLALASILGEALLQPWLLTLVLCLASSMLLLAEYFLIRFVARKSYDYLFIAPISSL